ncbi:serine/threonine protein kinase [Candidatus Brocadia sinica JPN1]|uniref:Serine/threonine protein kinase n=1 Tax=Candidatus Brocadia sinica JPN1 TaxID=1197129 RepID=A0ABQ0K2B4_9BACT|nr:serine/threonine protein kinase [Candidatus Brocadia sinica JPN1]
MNEAELMQYRSPVGGGAIVKYMSKMRITPVARSFYPYHTIRNSPMDVHAAPVHV